MDATVVYLKATGHVLTAVTCGALAPTLTDLTVDGQLRQRFPGTSKYVDVPVTLLKVARLPIEPEALDRLQSWVVIDDESLGFSGAPKIDSNSNAVTAGVAGKPFVSVWQTPDGPTPAEGFLDANGKPTGDPPPQATERLLAFEGGVLHLVKAP